ncbi:unnamed protein product [Paramecium pentaurelia]|uniref:Uncharacterized protein n=1 Tax=Paramecium pentaurelia TaxID=43138 RepID=A0A8S1TFS9_9CILI|nr:unnamed protein product [Paramecium pentaurelia]
MNSFRRVVTKTKTSIFLHKESIDNVLREQLAALRLLQPKTQIVDQKLEQRKQELLYEMSQENLQKDDNVDIAGFQQIFAELSYINNKKRSQIQEDIMMKNDQVITIPEIELQNEIDQEMDCKQILEKRIDQIEHSVRIIEKQNNLLKEQIELYTKNEPKIQLKEIENKQQLSFFIHYINTIKKAMKLEKEWQTQKIEKLKYKAEKSQLITEANLKELLEQEDREMSLLLKYEQTSDLINQIDEDIKTKFHKIEECAELLEEFDDIDKLRLIFVLENPNDFELDEILQHVRCQLRQPFSRLQLASSLQEYIDRARFSGVSSRIKIFFKFHDNDLNYSINQLIQVYRKLQFQDGTLRNRYEDLLIQKGQLINHLLFLNQLQFYELDEPESIAPQIDEQQHEMAQYFKNIQVRYLSNNKYFFVRIFTMLTTVLSRILNSLYNIKEILKSCNSDMFGHEFYLKWTYNKMFIQLSQVIQQLEKQYKIKLIAKDPSIRNSNQFLNAIYDHIEEKALREKTLINPQQKQTIDQILPQLSPESIQKISQLINQDIFLQQFFSIQDLAQLLNNQNACLNESEVIKLIQIEGYDLAHCELRSSTNHLFRVIQDIIIECRTVKESSVQAKSLAKKYHIQEIIDKHMSSYEYKQKEWKKEVIENKIKQIEHQFDEISEAPTTPEMKLKSSIATNSTHVTSQPSKLILNSQMTKESTLLTPTSNNLRRYLNTVESQIPNKKSYLPKEPIFAHLHQMSRKIKNEKISTQTHLRTFTLQSIDSTKQHSQQTIPLKLLPSIPVQNFSQNLLKQPTNKIINRQNRKTQIVKTEPTVKLEIKQTHNFSDIYEKSNKKIFEFFRNTSMKIK